MSEPTRHRLFFALRPPPDVAVHIGELRDAVRVRGSRVGDERLHVTLFLGEDHPALPPDLAERAIEAASGIVEAPFYVLFDRLVGGGGPTVLVPSEPLPALTAFQRQLAVAMTEGGLVPRPDWTFRPHVTLLYGNRCTTDAPVEPLSWLVGEFVLVHSFVGEGRHVTLARWPLTADRAA